MHLTLFYLPDFPHKKITQAHCTSQRCEFNRVKPDCWLHQMFKQWSHDKYTGLLPTHWCIIITCSAMRYHTARVQIIFMLYILLFNCFLLLGSKGFWKHIQHTLRPSREDQQRFWYFTSFFGKWNAMLHLTRASWVHTGEQKGNFALLILHKWLNMIFHLCYLTFFSLKDSLTSHAVVHI